MEIEITIGNFETDIGNESDKLIVEYNKEGATPSPASPVSPSI